MSVKSQGLEKWVLVSHTSEKMWKQNLAGDEHFFEDGLSSYWFVGRDGAHCAAPETGSGRDVLFFFFVCTGSLLWHSGLSLVLAQGLSCLAVCGILVPWPGMEPTSPVLEGRFLTNGPPGKSWAKYISQGGGESDTGAATSVRSL